MLAMNNFYFCSTISLPLSLSTSLPSLLACFKRVPCLSLSGWGAVVLPTRLQAVHYNKPRGEHEPCHETRGMRVDRFFWSCFQASSEYNYSLWSINNWAAKEMAASYYTFFILHSLSISVFFWTPHSAADLQPSWQDSFISPLSIPLSHSISGPLSPLIHSSFMPHSF